MEHRSENRFVLTGGPGLGKSSVLAGLRRAGLDVFPEAARVYIDAWRARGSATPAPWEDRDSFDAAITTMMLRDYEQAGKERPAVYDRGLPDLIAWRAFLNRARDRKLERLVAEHPYERLVFITPEWAPWYVQDDDRPFTLSEVFAINKKIDATYRDLGYGVVQLPRATIPERVDFITEVILRYLGQH